MIRISSVAFGTGLGATAIVAILAQVGALDSPEHRSIDWRYQNARHDPQPLSDQIALVAIDDSSFNMIGRWPWPRAVLAQAISELVGAGAKTIALDILLSEPDAAPEGDAALAAALEGTRAVLGIDIGRRLSLSDAWSSPEGIAQLKQLVEVLSGEIDLAPKDAAIRAGLDGARERAFLAAPLEFKSLAVWRTIWRLADGGEIPSLDVLVMTMTGGRSARGGADFDAIRRIDEIWERARSWRLLQEELVYVGGHESAKEGHIHEPPIPALARTADGVGVATSDVFDADGSKRRTGVCWEVPGGTCHQFGFVAATTHLGIVPSAIAVTERSVRAGSVEIPLIGPHLELDWPTSTFEGFPAMAGFSAEGRPAISIAWLVSLSRERVKLARMEDECLKAREALRQGVPSLGGNRGESMNGAAFASEVEDASLGDTVSESERDLAQRFLTSYQASEDGREHLADATAQLRAMVDGKLVFVGWTATGALADQVQTPLDPNTPGVFVHAVIADMVLSGRSRGSAPQWVMPVAVIGIGAAAALLSATLPTLWSTIGALTLASAWGLFVVRYAFPTMALVLPLVAPVVAPIASWATSTAAVAVIASRDRARITRQFAARVSPQLVEQLARSPNALTVTGDERVITVMFGDLAGFTSIAEKLGGPGVVRTLNKYLGRLADELVNRNAYVNKFLGDGFMAFWSAFSPEPRQEALAAESAVACQRLMKELGAQAEEGMPTISVRLGIATGLAVVGDCGAPPRLNDYTAIGDVVNLASRLESANKQFGTGILIDGMTREGIERAGGNTDIAIRPLGLVVVVGQSVPVEVFEVVSADAEVRWIQATERAVSHFRAKRLAESGVAWKEYEQEWGASKLSRLYLESIEANIGADDGVLRLRAK
ncbi:MAG: adenylate/guanylate cyclase domain-containing protein [Phycisphaerales bacterium]|nr:adenylate/guanylate cyclase domain-containing protein [Phycisphaerales bacterium]